MFAIVRYVHSMNVFLAKATKNPNEYVIIECLKKVTYGGILKPGNLITQGTKCDNKVFTLIDTEEKLGEFLLEYKL